MVEMTETANILQPRHRRAAWSSSTRSAAAPAPTTASRIAWAIVEYLHDRRARLPHALRDALPRADRAGGTRCRGSATSASRCSRKATTVVFLHRVVPGGADRSYGIHVAALAGLPSGVIARARQVLAELERQRPLEPPEQQLGLPMEMAPDPLRKELEEIEPDSLSPLEALQKLYELRSRLNG